VASGAGGGGRIDGEVAQLATVAASAAIAIPPEIERLRLGGDVRDVDDPCLVMTDPSSRTSTPAGSAAGDPPADEAGASRAEASGAERPGPRRDVALEAGLYVVSTPIGNLRDVTLRALDTLASADRVYAEDTRVTIRLLNAYGIKARLSAYHEHSGEGVRGEILAALARGERIALVSDAGTPLISDPGFKIVRAAIAAGARVIPIPGASALTAALAGAGLATDQFFFAGFPPAKTGARTRFLDALAGVDATLVFYESGGRLGETLAAMAAAFGTRDAVIARELTKLHEEFRRGTLEDLAHFHAAAEAPKGEIVVLVGPPGGAAAPDASEIDAALRAALSSMSVKDAAALVAGQFGVARQQAYARALALKNAPDTDE